MPTPYTTPRACSPDGAATDAVATGYREGMATKAATPNARAAIERACARLGDTTPDPQLQVAGHRPAASLRTETETIHLLAATPRMCSLKPFDEHYTMGADEETRASRVVAVMAAAPARHAGWWPLEVAGEGAILADPHAYRSCWMLGDMPLLVVDGDEALLAPGVRRPLADAIADIASGKLVATDTLTREHHERELWLHVTRCFACGAPSAIWSTWTVFAPGDGCEANVRVRDRLDYDDARPEFAPEAQARAEALAAAHQIPCATVKERYSAPANRSYRSFGCAGCDALFGDHYLYGLPYAARIPRLLREPLADGRGESLTYMPHWCTRSGACASPPRRVHARR